MSTTFYIRVPICRRNGIGDGKVKFTWHQKLPEYLKLISYKNAEIMDEYGRVYSNQQFGDELLKGEAV